MERLAGLEPATFDLASRRSNLLSYNRMEPSPRFELGPPPYRGGALTARTTKASLGRAWDSTLDGIRTRSYTALNRARLPVAARAYEPPPGADPGRPPYGGGAATVRGGKLPIMDSNHD
jgi:hypothetical protein